MGYPHVELTEVQSYKQTRKRRYGSKPYGYGTYFDKNTNLFHARVRSNGKNLHVGRYETQEDAVVARAQFIERHGI